MVEVRKARVNVDVCRQKGEDLVMHNRWSALVNEEGEPEEENLEQLVERFLTTLDSVSRRLGVKETVGNYKC